MILKECVDYFTDNVVQHRCIPLYNATCIANPNTMRKMVLKGDCSAERIVGAGALEREILLMSIEL